MIECIDKEEEYRVRAKAKGKRLVGGIRVGRVCRVWLDLKEREDEKGK